MSSSDADATRVRLPSSGPGNRNSMTATSSIVAATAENHHSGFANSKTSPWDCAEVDHDEGSIWHLVPERPRVKPSYAESLEKPPAPILVAALGVDRTKSMEPWKVLLEKLGLQPGIFPSTKEPKVKDFMEQSGKPGDKSLGSLIYVLLMRSAMPLDTLYNLLIVWKDDDTYGRIKHVNGGKAHNKDNNSVRHQLSTHNEFHRGNQDRKELFGWWAIATEVESQQDVNIKGNKKIAGGQVSKAVVKTSIEGDEVKAPTKAQKPKEKRVLAKEVLRKKKMQRPRRPKAQNLYLAETPPIAESSSDSKEETGQESKNGKEVTNEALVDNPPPEEPQPGPSSSKKTSGKSKKLPVSPGKSPLSAHTLTTRFRITSAIFIQLLRLKRESTIRDVEQSVQEFEKDLNMTPVELVKSLQSRIAALEVKEGTTDLEIAFLEGLKSFEAWLRGILECEEIPYGQPLETKGPISILKQVVEAHRTFNRGQKPQEHDRIRCFFISLDQLLQQFIWQKPWSDSDLWEEMKKQRIQVASFPIPHYIEKEMVLENYPSNRQYVKAMKTLCNTPDKLELRNQFRLDLPADSGNSGGLAIASRVKVEQANKPKSETRSTESPPPGTATETEEANDSSSKGGERKRKRIASAPASPPTRETESRERKRTAKAMDTEK